MKMRGRHWPLLAALLMGVIPAWAEDEVEPAVETSARPEAIQQRSYSDRLQLESTSIRGNQELPRVMYIVPWKDPSLGDVTGKPVNSLVDEVLAPLDRDVFLRQTKYFDQLYGSPETAVSD